MPKKAKDVIGQEITTIRGVTFKVIKELERGMSRDRNNGYDEKRPTIRRFDVECQKCKNIRSSDYKNIFIAKNLLCYHCDDKPKASDKEIPNDKPKTMEVYVHEPKLMKNGEVDKRYIREPKTEFVGNIYECAYDTFLVLEELPRILSKNGKYVYRNFRVECQRCGTQRETLAASLNSKGVACQKCRKEVRKVKLVNSVPPVNIEQKIEIMHEINQIWDEMKRMQRMGELTKYLVDKFNVHDWLLSDDEETTYIERDNDVDDSDDIDYDNPDIDWDNELGKYI